MQTDIVSGAFALYVSAVHIGAGQRYVVEPLEASNATPISRSALFVVFHMVSFTLVATALTVGAFGGQISMGFRALLAAQIAVATALFLFRGQSAHQQGFAMPQWIVLGPLAVAIVVGERAVPVTLMAIAALHVAWACGVSWPSPSRRMAPAYVVGWPAGTVMPSRAATLTVAAVLVAMTVAIVRGPSWAVYATACVFAARGLFGLVEAKVRPGIVETPYRLLSALFYSPLCLFVAALILVGAWRG